MSKKKSTKSKRAPSVRGEKLYEAYSSKIEASAIGKKVADKEHKGHTPLVARVLLSFDKPVTAAQVITAAKNSGYKSDNVERCVRGDLAILVREGLVKATKIEAAKPATEKKAKKPRKPRAKKSKANGHAAADQDLTDNDIPKGENDATLKGRERDGASRRLACHRLRRSLLRVDTPGAVDGRQESGSIRRSSAW